MIGIYFLENKVNRKLYVGQSVNIRQRVYQHATDKRNYPICLAIQKYGIDNFEWGTLELCSEELLTDRERHWIASLDCIAPNGYNLTDGGEGGRHLLETCQRISKSNIGKVMSPETREKMRKAKLGKKLSPMCEETKRKIGNANRGRRHTPEARKKMSLAKRGVKLSVETRQKMSKAQKRRYSEVPKGFTIHTDKKHLGVS